MLALAYRWVRVGQVAEQVRSRSQRLVRLVLDLLFPPRCVMCSLLLEPGNGKNLVELCAQCRQKLDFADRPVCLRCGAYTTVFGQDAQTCSWCRELRLCFDRAICLGPYSEGLGQIVLQLKRWPRPSLICALAQLLLRDRRINLQLKSMPDVVVPVPQHWLRRVLTGLDPVQMFAEELANRLGIPCFADALRRRRFGPPQRGLSVERRFVNAGSLYELWDGDFHGLHVLAVDDVLTTGATLSAIAKILKKAGAREVTAVAIARAEGIDPAGR